MVSQGEEVPNAKQWIVRVVEHHQPSFSAASEPTNRVFVRVAYSLGLRKALQSAGDSFPRCSIDEHNVRPYVLRVLDRLEHNLSLAGAAHAVDHEHTAFLVAAEDKSC
jgi:hypothetical protein